jgi:hypothetical protein
LVASLTMIILQTALLAIRSPPWLSRCRFVLPDEAGMGEAPHKLAKGASPHALASRSTASDVRGSVRCCLIRVSTLACTLVEREACGVVRPR